MNDKSAVQNIHESAAFSKYQSYSYEIWIEIDKAFPQFNGNTKIEIYATYRPVIYLSVVRPIGPIFEYDERNPVSGKWWRIAGELIGKKEWIDKGYRKTIPPMIPMPERREIAMQRISIRGGFYAITFAAAYDSVSDTLFVYVP